MKCQYIIMAKRGRIIRSIQVTAEFRLSFISFTSRQFAQAFSGSNPEILIPILQEASNNVVGNAIRVFRIMAKGSTKSPVLSFFDVDSVQSPIIGAYP